MRLFRVRTALPVCALALFSAALSAAPFVEIQPVDVQNAATNAEIANELTFAQAIYAQIGLTVTILPTETSATLPTNMDVTTFSGEDTFLFDSTWQAAPVLTAWFVDSINNNAGIRGVSFEDTFGRFGIGISQFMANDTLAHEIGHVLSGFNAIWQPITCDPAHSSDPTNLLAPGGETCNSVTTIRNVPSSTAQIFVGSAYDQLPPSQATVMLDSPFVQTPEPATAAVAGFGLIAVVVIRKKLVA